MTTVDERRRIEAGVEPARTSRKERYAMSRDSNVLRFRQPEAVDDPLTELAREGARRMLAQVMVAEADFLSPCVKDLKLPDGRDRVVRHGHGPDGRSRPGLDRSRCGGRRCATAATWARRRRSASLVDPAAMGAADEEPRCPAAGSVPARRLDRRLPGGARGAARQGRAEPVARGDRAADRRMAGGIRCLAEARPLGTAIRLRLGGRRLPAGADGSQRRMHAGADGRHSRGQEGSSASRPGCARARRAGASC